MKSFVTGLIVVLCLNFIQSQNFECESDGEVEMMELEFEPSVDFTTDGFNYGGNESPLSSFTGIFSNDLTILNMHSLPEKSTVAEDNDDWSFAFGEIQADGTTINLKKGRALAVSDLTLQGSVTIKASEVGTTTLPHQLFVEKLGITAATSVLKLENVAMKFFGTKSVAVNGQIQLTDNFGAANEIILLDGVTLNNLLSVHLLSFANIPTGKAMITVKSATIPNGIKLTLEGISETTNMTTKFGKLTSTQKKKFMLVKKEEMDTITATIIPAETMVVKNFIKQDETGIYVLHTCGNQQVDTETGEVCDGGNGCDMYCRCSTDYSAFSPAELGCMPACNSDYCVSCDTPYNCVQCTENHGTGDGKNCETCSTGYKGNTDNIICSPICLGGCVSCQSPGMCASCQVGYMDGAESISNSQSCYDCEAGYRRTVKSDSTVSCEPTCSSSQCEGCNAPEKCDSCKAPRLIPETGCTSCEKGYYLLEGSTDTCVDLCFADGCSGDCVEGECTGECIEPYDKTGCASCKFGYTTNVTVKNNKRVVACTPTCPNAAFCKTGKCSLPSECEDGECLNDGYSPPFCTPICESNGCDRCTDANVCSRCRTVYASPETGCKSCAVGYAYDNVTHTCNYVTPRYCEGIEINSLGEGSCKTCINFGFDPKKQCERCVAGYIGRPPECYFVGAVTHAGNMLLLLLSVLLFL